jgi:transposase-like protein
MEGDDLMKPNLELRFYARGKGVSLWRVAKEYDVHENTLLQWLRTEFSGDEAARFKAIVDGLADEQARGGAKE